MNNRRRKLASVLSACLFCFMHCCSLISQERERRASPSFPNLIVNGDFEDYDPQSNRECWRLSPSNLFAWDTFSYSGDHALSIDASKIPARKSEKPEAAISYKLKNIKPGVTYLFEVHLCRNKNITGVYPSLRVFGLEQRLNDFWREDGWQRLSLLLKSSARADSDQPARLELRIPKDNYRLWIDDLSLREFGVSLLSPEAGRRLRAGAVDFAWEIPETDRLLSQKLVLSRTSRFEPSRSLEIVTDNDSDRSSASAVLEPGIWYWRVAVQQFNRPIAVSSTASFIIQGESLPPKSRVAGRPLHSQEDGKQIPNHDFFPIGLFNADAADCQELARIGFNAAQISPEDAQSLLSSLASAQKFGLKVLIPCFPDQATLRRLELASAQHVSEISVREPRSQLWPADLTRSPLLAPWQHLWRWITRGLDQSGALLGFYLADEPEGRGIPPRAVYRNYRTLRTAGFRQPAVVVLNRPWRTIDYAQTADVIMADNYPVPFNPLSWLSDCLDEIRRTLGGGPGQRVWAAIQAFAWNDMSDEVAQHGLGREPSAEEVRALSYLAIAHQASGVFFYAYGPRNGAIKERSQLWEGVMKTVKELRTILPLLSAPEGDKARRVMLECRLKDGSGRPAVHYTIRELTAKKGNIGQGIYLIAINSTEKNAVAKFSLEGIYGARWADGGGAVDVFSGERYPLSGGVLRVNFPPYARLILRLEDVPSGDASARPRPAL